MEGLSQAEAFARIRLLRSPNVGPVSYRQLLHRFGAAEAALSALPDLIQRGGGGYRPAAEDRIAAEVQAVRTAGARYLFHDSPDYPPLLAEQDGAPPILTCRGDANLALRPCVAIVGARNASAAAVKLARMFAGELAEAGYVVVSGLARGIDGAAHQASLSGGTIGVIASGIDITYPPEHADLQAQIGEEGRFGFRLRLGWFGLSVDFDFLHHLADFHELHRAGRRVLLDLPPFRPFVGVVVMVDIDQQDARGRAVDDDPDVGIHPHRPEVESTLLAWHATARSLEVRRWRDFTDLAGSDGWTVMTRGVLTTWMIGAKSRSAS